MPQRTTQRSFLRPWLLLASLLLVVGGNGAYQLWQEHLRIERDETNRLEARTRIVEQVLGRQLEAIGRTLDSVRDDLSHRVTSPAQRAEVERRLKDFEKAMTGVRSLVAVDAQGIIYASNRSELAGLDVSGRDYVQRVKRRPDPTTLYVGEPFRSVLGVVTLPVARMITGPDGRYGGLVAAALDPNEFHILLDSVRHTADARSALVHGGGKVFLHLPEREGTGILDMAHAGTLFSRHRDSGRASNVIVGTDAIRARERMASLRNIQPARLNMDTPLVAIVVRDVEPILAAWRSRAYQQATLLALLVMASVVVMTSLQRRQRRRLEAAEALAESENRFRIISELSSDLLYSCRRDHSGSFRFDWLAGNCNALFGVDPDRLKGFGCWRRFVIAEDQQLFTEAIAALQPGDASDRVLRIQHPDGSLRYIRSLARVVHDGGRHRLYGGLRDITEQTRQERETLDTRNQLQAILDALPDLMFILDQDGRFVDYHSPRRDLLALPPEAFLGKAMAEVLPADVVEVSAAALREAAEKGCSNGKRYSLGLGGEVRYFELSVCRQAGPSGTKPRFVVLTRDITEREAALANLERERGILSGLIQTIPDLVWLKNPEGVYLACNARFESFFAASQADIMGKTDYDFVDRELADFFRDNDRKAMEKGGPSVNEEWVTFASDGHRELLETTRTPMFDAQGRLIGVLGIGHDITERKATQEKVRQSEASLRILLDSLQEAVYVLDKEGRFIAVNAGATRMYGYPQEWFVGKTPADVAAPGHNDLEDVAVRLTQALQGHPQSFEFVGLRSDGSVFPKEVHLYRGEWFGKAVVFALGQDITERKEHQRELEHIAHYDALTGLPNRVLLHDRLYQAMVQAWRRGQKLAVAYVDLDGFKAVNDVHGHEVGDQLLMTVAGRMRQSLREGDTIARLGGDEFVAVLIDLDEEKDCVPLLTRLLDAAARPMDLGDLALKVSASLGVTFYPQTEEVDADQLLRQADQAMYQAKLAGKNRYHLFDAEQDRSVRGHHESLERIQRALADGEFVLYYQPKVNLRNGELLGAEALIRWRHPESGLLQPAAFLPIVEDHALAVEIGEWVIDAALAQIEAWQAQGLAIPVSVNVGARQLQRADFVQRLETLLAAHPAVPPSRLELEVLETSALADVTHVSEVMSACAGIGVTFALDDFGTGYSSLTYLKRLPAGLLKIDQSFVRDMLDDPDDLAILEGVLGLATAFRRQVLAEGVETVAHGELLLQLGCERGQGYGIARPMPADDLPGWASAWRPDPAWREQARVRRDDLPLLFAAVEHRAWIRGIESLLQGSGDGSPALDHQVCRFGQWLAGEAATRHGSSPGFQAVVDLHRQVHDLAASLLDRQRHRQAVDVGTGIAELHALRDALLERLTGLLGTGDRPH